MATPAGSRRRAKISITVDPALLNFRFPPSMVDTET